MNALRETIVAQTTFVARSDVVAVSGARTACGPDPHVADSGLPTMRGPTGSTTNVSADSASL